MESCSGCGAAVTPATSFIADTGVLCATCFRHWEVAQRAALNAAGAEEAVMLHRASVLASLNGLNWAVGVILLAGWGHVPGWLTSSLVGAFVVVAFALRVRARWAFRAAMVFDTAGALAFLIASVAQIRDVRLAVLLFPALFAGWMGFVTWRARSVFEPA